MPIYAMRCDICGKNEDIFRSVSNMDKDLPVCCGKEMHRVIFAPMVQNDIQPYTSMIDGSIIESRSKHREHLKQHGMIEVGNETKYLTKRKPLESPDGLKRTIAEVANCLLKEK